MFDTNTEPSATITAHTNDKPIADFPLYQQIPKTASSILHMNVKIPFSLNGPRNYSKWRRKLFSIADLFRSTPILDGAITEPPFEHPQYDVFASLRIHLWITMTEAMCPFLLAAVQKETTEDRKNCPGTILKLLDARMRCQDLNSIVGFCFEFFDFRWKSGSTIDEYDQELSSLRDQIEETGIKIDEKMYVSRLIHGLPKCFKERLLSQLSSMEHLERYDVVTFIRAIEKSSRPIASKQSRKDFWILDSGASSHISGNMELFESLTPLSPPRTIDFANSQTGLAHFSGTVVIPIEGREPLVLKNVLFVEGAAANLLALQALVSKGGEVRLKMTGISTLLDKNRRPICSFRYIKPNWELITGGNEELMTKKRRKICVP